MSTPDIITRPEWGARYANGFGLRTIGDLDVYLHHSVTIAPDLLPPFTDDYAAVRTLEAIGQSRFGRGISYHFPVTPAGLVFEGLGIDRIGAAIARSEERRVGKEWGRTCSFGLSPDHYTTQHKTNTEKYTRK